MKTFKLKLLTEKAKALKDDLSKRNKGVTIFVTNDTITFIFKSRLVSKFVSINAFHIQLADMGLSKEDYEVELCN